MLVLISSLKLSIVPCAAGPESRGHSWTAFVNISMSSCFPSFIVRWILNFMDEPTHENHENWYPTNKSDFTVVSPIRCGFAPNFVNYKKGALDLQPQVIKFTSFLPWVGGSLRVLRLPPPLKLVAMI